MPTLMDALTRHWWAFVIRGLVAILFGIACWVWPGLTLTALVIVFGAYALVDGIFAVAAGIASYGENRRWWAEILVGLAGVAAGIVAWVWPGITALTLLYIIALWAIASGVFEIGAAVELRHSIENEWFLGIGGALSVLFGILLIIFPGSGALALLWLIGAYAVLFGSLLIALGFRARGLRQTFTQRGRLRQEPGSHPLA
jgi:uncharacterized membrane protein HdeD (DUF308 family)